MLMVTAASLSFVAWLVWGPWLREHQRSRIRAQVFPAPWRRILRRRVPMVAKLPTPLQQQLKRHMQVFLAEKPLIGCGGMQINDEVRVTVAAQACLLLLGRSEPAYFPLLKQILVYPAAFVVQREVGVGAGVLSEQRRALAGESWTQGQVILSWQDCVQGAALPDDGHNVVIHEFAHQLDQEKGHANGAPILARRSHYEAWSQVMQNEYLRLQADVAQGLPTLLDPYGATDPAEFFAVASEVFFERGRELSTLHPALYDQLRSFYRLDPANWN